MKRLVSILLTVIMVMSVGVTGLAIDASAAETAIVNGKACEVGTNVTYTVDLCVDTVLEDFQGEVTYDSQALQLISAKIPNASAGVMINTAVADYIYYSGSNFMAPYDFKEQKVFLTAEFKVLKAGTYTVANKFEVMTGQDENGNSINPPFVLDGIANKEFTTTEEVVADSPVVTTTSTTATTSSTTATTATTPIVSNTTFNGKNVNVGDKVTVSCYVKTDQKCEDFDVRFYYGANKGNASGIELASLDVYETKGSVMSNTALSGEIRVNGASFSDPYDFDAGRTIATATFLIKEGNADYFANSVMYILTGSDGTYYATNGVMETPFTWSESTDVVPATTTTTTSTTTATTSTTSATTTSTTKPSTTTTSTTVPVPSDTTFNGQKVSVGDKVTVTYYVQTDKKCEDFDARMTYGTKTINPNGLELVSFTPVQTKGSAIYNTDIYGEIYYNATSFNDPYDFTTKSALMSATFLIKEAGGQYFADGVMYYLTGVDGTDYATKGQMNTPFTWEVQYSSVPVTTSSSTSATTTSSTTATTTTSTTTTSTTTAPAKEYQVINNLVNVKSSSSATTVKEGSTFTTILVPNTGYKISTVVANNGSQTITPVYNNDGTVTLSAVVVGDIVISAIAIENPTTTTTTSTTTATTTTSTTTATTTTSTTTATTTTSTTRPSSTKETVPETKPGDVIEISKISLDKAAITVNEGQKINIVASIWPGYTTEKTVTWSVNNSRVGVCSQTKNTSIGLYDDEGKLYCTETATFTAKASGQTIIKAVSNTGLVAKCVVNVKPVAKTLTVSKSSVTLNVGKYTTVKATVGPASISSTYKKVAWTTSNKKVATVTSAGKIVARGKGVCTVYATSSDNTTLKKAIKVTVKQPVTSVKFNKSSIKLAKKGASKNVKVTASPSNANNKSLTIKSENTKIAKVSKSTVNSGAKIKVTAVKKGSTYVRATAKDGSKKYARIKVTVKK
ncbi:MAG: Ig-like domain-containing protein [Ruminococcus sp.]